jgi:hypothetical protein
MAEESNPSPEGATVFKTAARPRRLHHPDSRLRMIFSENRCTLFRIMREWRSPEDSNLDPRLRTAALCTVKLGDRYSWCAPGGSNSVVMQL